MVAPEGSGPGDKLSSQSGKLEVAATQQQPQQPPQELPSKRILLETHPGFDLKAQSRKFDGGKRVWSLAKSGEDADLATSPEPERVRTLLQLFRHGQSLAKGGGPCLGQRFVNTAGEPGVYVWLSYDEVMGQAMALAKGLSTLGGIRSGQRSLLGVYLRNCPDWIIVEMAAYLGCRGIVALYATSDAVITAQIAKQTAVQVLFTDSLEKAAFLLAQAKAAPSLKYIVYCRRPGPPEDLKDLRRAGSKAGIEVLDREELVAKGASAAEPKGEPEPEDVSSICYTSGSEGETKGVVLTHANLVASASAVTTLVGRTTRIRGEDCVFSYLPLAHIQQRSVELAAFARGARVGYLWSKAADFHKDMRALKPTIFVTVPRTLENLHRRVYKDASKLTRGVLKFALWTKKRRSKDREHREVVTKTSIMDRICFRSRQQQLGGEVRLILVGSAPVQPQILKDLRLIYGALVMEGYGMTETSGAVTLTNEADLSGGHVGPPVPAAAIKLADIASMDCSTIDDKGEVLVRGPLVARGYLRHVQAGTGRLLTTSLTDEAGWFHSGDVGEWTESGCLRIVDRLKNIFKLPVGVFVSPEKLETAYQHSKYVDQIFVTGDPLKPWLVGVAVPDMEMFALCAQEDFAWKGTLVDGELSETDRLAMCKSEQVRAVVLADLLQAGSAFGLSAHERLANVTLRPERFTAENGLVAPDGKLKRYELRRRFKTEIARLYQEMEANTQPLARSTSMGPGGRKQLF